MHDDPNVVLIREPKGDKDNDSIPGIRGIYQLRTTGDTRTIQYREVACWCPSCIMSDYDKCLVKSQWTSVTLDAGTSKPKRTNKCSVCKQPGHNKNSLLCVGKIIAAGPIFPVTPENITTLNEALSNDEGNSEEEEEEED